LVDISTPEMGAFFKRIGYTPPPGIKRMKQSELTALGKPSQSERDNALGINTNEAIPDAQLRTLAKLAARGGPILSFGMGAKNPNRGKYYGFIADEINGVGGGPPQDVNVNRMTVKGLNLAFAQTQTRQAM